MSWMKRRTSGAPSPAPTPPIQMFNPNQHSNTQENQWQTPQQQQPQNWYNPAQQQQQQPMQAQQPQGNYWQQNFSDRAIPTLQPPPQNMQRIVAPPVPLNVPQPAFNQKPYGGPQHPTYNYDNYELQQPVYNNSQYDNRQQFNQKEADSWGNWAWGDEDNNVPQQRQEAENTTGLVSNPTNLADSFANDQSWNWSTEDQKNQQISPADQQNSEVFAKMKPPQQKQLNRAKLETPQWSTESQVSQESSDDILHTSESDKSRVLSQSSTSPSGADPPMPPMPNTHHRLQNMLIPPLDSPVASESLPLIDTNPQAPSTDNNLNATAGLPPPMVPPPVFAQPPLGGAADDSSNPYKRTTGVGHRNRFLQAVTPVGQAPAPPFPIVGPTPHLDGKEAPMNDRNQYLETGQLSESGEYVGADAVKESSNGDILPPPGFHRMVPGQMGHAEGIGMSRPDRDEPPPGLSRMVLGQNEAPPIATDPGPQEPPAGLRRMVPGESGSPESSLRQQNRQEDSEPELALPPPPEQPPRSATIGADTPPAIQIDEEQVGFVSNNGRRRFAEGQPQDVDVDNLAGSVRNLTVGENLTDGQTSNASIPMTSSRRHSVQESSDSEPEHNKKPPKGPPRDRRSAEKTSKSRDKDSRDKRRGRERDSPDDHRDRKDRSRRYREKRYEDDTDYYSDKEKDRRIREDRDREYDRKYSSLKKEKDKRRRGERERDYFREPRRDYYYNKYEGDYEPDSRSRPSSRSDSLMESSYRERRHDGKEHRRPPKDRERDRDRYNRHREAFNPYQGVAYDPYSPYYQQYQYYENLRRTNPQAYAEWYRRYYQQAVGGGAGAASFAGEDRASVHSGRSSANDELAKDRYSRHGFYSPGSVNNVSGYYRDEVRSSGHYSLDTSSYSRFDQTNTSMAYPQPIRANQQRLTPAKFATAHLKASIISGKLVKVLPAFPLDGDEATVEISDLGDALLDDEEFKELNSFPGPLVTGVTHKKTIIEYCENKIRRAAYRKIVDVDSYVLMWELMILLIRQNGMVVGADIAELLLKDGKPSKTEILQRPASVNSNLSSNAGDNSDHQNDNTNTGSNQSVLKEEEVVNKFREYLLYGSGKEALEWAMKNGLWGHALFLASKLDKRTYANVMMRFANGIAANDPLQTLYQLLSGKVPAAVTCVSDERWGSWRPHLAMVLSNSSQRPELNQRSIAALGDTLRGRGSPYAAHFCYLMARAGFGSHADPDARLVLLGADHVGREPAAFAATEAIHMTEVYEYACGLNDAAFAIADFQAYKFLLATRLADRGLLDRSLQYLEKISSYIVGNPAAVNADFVRKVCDLADRLKFYDPSVDGLDESEFGSAPESSRPDNSWLKDLKEIAQGLHPGQTRREIETEQPVALTTMPDDSQSYEGDPGQQQSYQQPSSLSWQMEQQQKLQMEQLNQIEQLQQQQQEREQQMHDSVVGAQPQQERQFAETFSDYQLDQQQQQQQQQHYWNQQQQQQPQQHWSDQLNQFGQENQQPQQGGYFQPNNDEIEPSPTISMPGQRRDEGGAPAGRRDGAPGPLARGAEDDKLRQQQQQSSGWFGGIFSKLALKPKNQMKLPDDKNPKIVWDQDTKRWKNMDEDPNDTSGNFKPPPKMSELIPRTASAPQHLDSYGGPQGPPTNVSAMNIGRENNAPMRSNATDLASQQQQQQNSEGPARPPQPNMFKMQRGRNLKSSYVDVFNPGGGGAAARALTLPARGGGAPAPAQVSFFVPAPVTDPHAPADFLTPGRAAVRPPAEHQQQIQ